MNNSSDKLDKIQLWNNITKEIIQNLPVSWNETNRYGLVDLNNKWINNCALPFCLSFQEISTNFKIYTHGIYIPQSQQEEYLKQMPYLIAPIDGFTKWNITNTTAKSLQNCDPDNIEFDVIDISKYKSCKLIINGIIRFTLTNIGADIYKKYINPAHFVLGNPPISKYKIKSCMQPYIDVNKQLYEDMDMIYKSAELIEFESVQLF